MKEEWKDIKGYEGIYKISNKGRIKSYAKTWYSGRLQSTKKTLPERIMKTRKNRGYHLVKLCKDGKEKACYVHKLVAEAFLPNEKQLPCVNHIDRNRSNSCVKNLEWCTYSENALHAHNDMRNNNEKVRKLNIQKVKEIKKLLGNMSVSEIAKNFKVDVTTIYAIKNEKIWKHVTIE